VEQSVARLLERANTVEGDLGKLVTDASGSISKLAETLRSGADKLRSDLDVPREQDRPAVTSPNPAPTVAAPAEQKPATPATMSAPASQPATAQPAAPAVAAPFRLAAPAASPLVTPEQPVPPGHAAGNGTSGVQPPAVGPRLEAFNMAKNGASRDEVARHLEAKRWRRCLTACLAYIACSVGCLAASLALRRIDYRWDHWPVIAICTVMGGGLSGWMLMTVVETRRQNR
jgi:hypothetical protein